MAGLFGQGQANAYVPTKYTQLNLQTSALGLPIPLMFGLNRCTTNVLWYNDFTATPLDGKGKGGGGKYSGSYTYTAAVILGLGEGPIGGINQVWSNGQTTTLGSLGLGLAGGSEFQNPFPYIVENYPSQAIPYGYTAYLFSSDYSLGESASVPEADFEVKGFFYNSMYSAAGVPDGNFADIIESSITSTQYGLDPNATYLDTGSLANFKTYTTAQGIFGSPYLNRQEKALSIFQRWLQLCNTWAFYNGVTFKFVPLGDVALSANGATYVPNNSPLFDFGPDDFVINGDDTLTVDIIDPWEGYNHVEIDILERSQYYNSFPIYWEDQASVDKYGQLQSQIISASEICSRKIGQTIAALIGQRSVYIRRNPKFKISLGVGVLLEPGDIVTLTHSAFGFNKYPVRITNVKEAENYQVEINCEEFPIGVGQVTVYPSQDGDGLGGLPNPSEIPSNVNTPLIFEPSLALTGGVPELWIGASGETNWGGAEVFVSPDGTNYISIGTINQPTQQGTLTSNLPYHADPDTTDTLAIDVTESAVTLSTAVTQAMADSFQTPCVVDTEMMSYGTVSLTGTNTYSLSYLRRGIYNTNIGTHTASAQWYGINPRALLTYTYPANYVGDTIYFKFCSFNPFGNSLQDISTVTAYPYTIQGTAYVVQPPTSCSLVAVNPSGTSQVNMVASWPSSVSPNVTGYECQFSQDSGATWTAGDDFVGPSSLSATLTAALASTNYVARVRASNTLGKVSTWTTSTVVNSGSYGSPPAAPGSLTAAQGTLSTVDLTIGASTGATEYLIFRAPGTSTSIGSATIIGTATTTSYIDTLSVGGSSYTYYAEAENSYGISPPSPGASITVTTTMITSNGTVITSNSNTIVL